MKGARAEDCAKTSSTPSTSRTMMIGNSQSFLFCRRNSQTSPASESLPIHQSPLGRRETRKSVSRLIVQRCGLHPLEQTLELLARLPRRLAPDPVALLPIGAPPQRVAPGGKARAAAGTSRPTKSSSAPTPPKTRTTAVLPRYRFHAAMASRTDATTSAVLRACRSVTRSSRATATLPFGSIKLKLLLPRKVFSNRALALLRLQKHELAQHEAVHLRPHEARVSLRGRADDRLAAHVEGGVHEHGAAGQSLEGREQFVVSGVLFAPHGLDARRVVNVRHSGDRGARHIQLLDAEETLFVRRQRPAQVLAHGRDQEHVGRVRVQLEVFRDALAQDRRREGAETFAELDLEIHLRLHAGRARVAENGARAESARPELHAPLKPADHLLLGQQPRDSL